jgi:hypothetical protein
VRSRRVILAASVVFLAAMVFLGFAVPPGRGTATTVDRLSLLVFWVLVMLVLGTLAAPRVRADDDGLLVVNMVRRRRLDWAQIVGLRFGTGDPWVQLDLSDGTTLAVMGIQRSDGPHAQRAAHELAAVVRSRQPTGDTGVDER